MLRKLVYDYTLLVWLTHHYWPIRLLWNHTAYFCSDQIMSQIWRMRSVVWYWISTWNSCISKKMAKNPEYKFYSFVLIKKYCKTDMTLLPRFLFLSWFLFCMCSLSTSSRLYRLWQRPHTGSPCWCSTSPLLSVNACFLSQCIHV